jgi:hypothetical protein
MRIVVALAMVSAFAAWAATPAHAEIVHVQRRGPVDLENFICEPVEKSAIRRVCYDETNRYLLVQLGSVYLHYCEVDPHIPYDLLQAESPAKFFNAEIRGRFDCRTRHMPAYN